MSKPKTKTEIAAEEIAEAVQRWNLLELNDKGLVQSVRMILKKASPKKPKKKPKHQGDAMSTEQIPEVPDPDLHAVCIDDLQVLRAKYPSLDDAAILLILLARARFYTSVEIWSKHVVPELRERDEDEDGDEDEAPSSTT